MPQPAEPRETPRVPRHGEPTPELPGTAGTRGGLLYSDAALAASSSVTASGVGGARGAAVADGTGRAGGVVESAAAAAAAAVAVAVGQDPGTAPLTPRRLQTRTRLLDAATLVFAEEGFLGASVESITQRAGFTRGAFYSNFSSKEELFVALLDREYAWRAASIRERADIMIEIIRRGDHMITPEDTARYVAEFFAPNGDEALWYALEAEFTLLAMREPKNAHDFTDFIGRFSAELGALVEEIAHAAGRRFLIPVERAMPILSGIYDRAFRITALRGADAPEGLGELGSRVAELLFVLTAPEDTCA